MAKLYFKYGAMGSSKTANALMVAFNYEEKGLKPLVLKPKLDSRDGEKIIKSRIGLSRKCEFVEDFILPDKEKTFEKVKGYDCIIIDEVQFCKIYEIRMLPYIVNVMKIPVICYGLKTDFLLNPFPAAAELLACADVIEELKTVCWCGQGATCNARIGPDGKIVREGKTIDLGGNDKYISLCFKHYMSGELGPKNKTDR
ncbi:MAG: Thymidine kinase [Lachnoclostridium sp.]